MDQAKSASLLHHGSKQSLNFVVFDWQKTFIFLRFYYELTCHLDTLIQSIFSCDSVIMITTTLSNNKQSTY